MKQILATITIAVTLAASNASAFDPADLKKLKEQFAIKECMGCDLSKANLTATNLYGANLREANLYGANLRAAGLSEADLRGANLTNADLTRAILHGTHLIGAILCNTIMPDESVIYKDC